MLIRFRENVPTPGSKIFPISGFIDAVRLRGALEQTFTFRATHDLPLQLPGPPMAWASAYAALARNDQLAWPTIEDVMLATRAFLDPVLQGHVVHTWSPSTWSWS
jgi:hypothetical protein